MATPVRARLTLAVRAPYQRARLSGEYHLSSHRTLLDEHFRVEGRRTWFETIGEMQAVLDDYLAGYNTKRPHQGRGMNGRTPETVFIAGLPKPQPKQKEKAEPRKRQDHIAA
jgi:transposase InsO family protein